MADPVVDWLLEGDPAIRCQTLRDLCDTSRGEVDEERRCVATEGWGARLLAEQAADGSWGGGLYSPDPSGDIATAESRGRDFHLDHRLYRSDQTGAVVNEVLTRFHFPPRWHYDVLRGLDYFRAVDAPRDERLTDGVALVNARQADGRWLLPTAYSGRTHFTLETVGKPSRWNTLRCLRVLRWWER